MGPAGQAFLLFLLLEFSGSDSKKYSSTKGEYLKSVCGRPKLTDRIMGGQDAAKGYWPWQVSIHMGLNHICGGSLINERWILTAAHCITSTWPLATYTVRVGTLKAEDPNEGWQYYVSKIIIHPNFKETTADIALLKLYSPVTFTSLVLPICLPNIKMSLSIPASCWVAGWGRVHENAGPDFYPTLQEVKLPVLDHKACERLYNPVSIFFPDMNPIIKEDMICAGDPDGKKDACKGDSGGPLSCDINGVWIQIGVVSWGLGCGQTLPAVYTSVLYYQQWINATISRAEVLGSKNLNLSNFLLPTVLLSLTLLGPLCVLWD